MTGVYICYSKIKNTEILSKPSVVLWCFSDVHCVVFAVDFFPVFFQLFVDVADYELFFLFYSSVFVDTVFVRDT